MTITTKQTPSSIACGNGKRGAVTVLVLAWVALPCCSAPAEQPERYTAAVREVRHVPYRELPNQQVREIVIVVHDRTAGETFEVIFGGPREAVTGDVQELRVVGDRLVVLAEDALALYDLGGRRTLNHRATLGASLAPNGTKIAYREFQPRFTPPEASGHVVSVLDVRMATAAAVFPSDAEITAGPGGTLLAWQPDPARRHSVGRLFWSPDSDRLVFFCKHGAAAGQDVPVTDYVVVVRPSAGVVAGGVVHQEIPRQAYLKPSIEVRGKRNLFNAADVEWLDDRKLRVIAPPGSWWVKEEVVLDLPVPGAATTESAREIPAPGRHV